MESGSHTTYQPYRYANEMIRTAAQSELFSWFQSETGQTVRKSGSVPLVI